MKCLLTLAVSWILTGCGTVVGHMADFYDARDPCQLQTHSRFTGRELKPQGWGVRDIPTWCGARSQPRVIRDAQGRVTGTLR
jgi:uncharacterized protein YceK